MGEEAGISVYNIKQIGEKYVIDIPENNESAVDTFIHLAEAVKNKGKPMYIVTGEEVGKGYDGEPLLKNVEVAAACVN